MRDPRNWARPAAAAAIGTTAGAALVVLRVRSQHKKRTAGDARHASKSSRRRCRHVADEARKLLRSLKRPTERRYTRRHGDLLPPPEPRDGGVVLELRPADLPGLHDADPGRHALPGVLARRRPRSARSHSVGGGGRRR